MENIKVCGDPHCEAIFHNCPKKETKCKDCDGKLIAINSKTFWKKYSKNYFQYDWETGDYFRPEAAQLELDL